MCIVFTWTPRSEEEERSPFSFILASNRDEFHARPSKPLHEWRVNGKTFYAGKDLEAGGTWCGVGEDGRFAVITNYRGKPDETQAERKAKEGYKSRGRLALTFLTSDKSPASHAAELRKSMDDYQGYNLLFGNVRDGKMWYMTNRYEQEKEKERCGSPYGVVISKEVAQGEECIQSGVTGLTNAILETPWKKLTKGKDMVAEIVNSLPKDASFESAKREVAQTLIHKVLRDTEVIAPTEDNRHLFPETGWSLENESILSSIFVKPFDIRDNIYGTRTSTVMLVNRDKTVLTVYEYNLNGGEWHLTETNIKLNPMSRTSSEPSAYDNEAHSRIPSHGETQPQPA